MVIDIDPETMPSVDVTGKDLKDPKVLLEIYKEVLLQQGLIIKIEDNEWNGYGVWAHFERADCEKEKS